MISIFIFFKKIIALNYFENQLDYLISNLKFSFSFANRLLNFSTI